MRKNRIIGVKSKYKINEEMNDIITSKNNSVVINYIIFITLQISNSSSYSSLMNFQTETIFFPFAKFSWLNTEKNNFQVLQKKNKPQFNFHLPHLLT